MQHKKIILWDNRLKNKLNTLNLLRNKITKASLLYNKKNWLGNYIFKSYILGKSNSHVHRIRIQNIHRTSTMRSTKKVHKQIIFWYGQTNFILDYFKKKEYNEFFRSISKTSKKNWKKGTIIYFKYFYFFYKWFYFLKKNKKLYIPYLNTFFYIKKVSHQIEWAFTIYFKYYNTKSNYRISSSLLYIQDKFIYSIILYFKYNLYLYYYLNKLNYIL